MRWLTLTLVVKGGVDRMSVAILGMTQNEEDRLCEALAFAIARLTEEERQRFGGDGKSCQLAAWESIWEKMRPVHALSPIDRG